MKEWRIVPGFEGAYRVSSDGVVQSHWIRGTKPRRQGRWSDLASPLDRGGYELVYLWDRSKERPARWLRHRLVATMFLPPVEGRTYVNHKNGNKRDNRVENLEWCTNEENVRHAWRNGLCRPHKLTADQVREIRSCGGLDTVTAKRFGVSQVLITKIRARKLWKHVA